MLLAVNANNTNVKFAVYDGSELRAEWRIHTTNTRTADEYAVWLVHLMELRKLKPSDITDVIIASVVPPLMFELGQLCERHFSCKPLIIGDPAVKLGIQVRIDRPSEVGADRLCNAVGAHLSHTGSLIVVDFGTATTFDVVNSAGDYCGGVIAPGINLSIEALHMATAKLPRIAVERPQKIIGKDTLACMQSGVFWGYVGLIEGLVARIRQEWGEPMRVLSTGGLAPLFVGATNVIDEVVPDISMRGLVEIFRRNKAA